MLLDKQSNSSIIEIPNFSKRFTKRNILQTLASMYDVLRFISPCLLTRKVIYRNVSKLKIQRENQSQWLKWRRDIHVKI